MKFTFEKSFPAWMLGGCLTSIHFPLAIHPNTLAKKIRKRARRYGYSKEWSDRKIDNIMMNMRYFHTIESGKIATEETTSEMHFRLTAGDYRRIKRRDCKRAG